MSEPILSAALAYASRGWAVFPADGGPAEGKDVSKAPIGRLVPRGLKDASADPDTIRRWWRDAPDAMIGFPTGPGPGCFVVDLDPRDKSCEALWADLEALIGEPLGAPPVCVTQSGGWHLYYRWPEGMPARADAEPGTVIGNRAGTRSGLPANVDVRGDGGYVILPPSVTHLGTVYAWQAGQGKRGLPEAPAALVDAILRRGRFAAREERRMDAPAPGVVPDASDRVRRYALAALDRETRTLAGEPKGGRNDALNAAAFRLGQLVGAGALSEAVARGALEAVASSWPNIRKSRGTIESGLRAGCAAPRDLSEIEAESRPRLAHAAPAPRPSRVEGQACRTVPEPDGEACGDGGGDDGGFPGDLADGGDGDGADPAIVAANARLEANDTGNGHRMLAWYRDEVLHVRDVGWHVWDGRRWASQGGDEAVSRLAQETARRIRHEVRHVGLSDDDLGVIEEARAIEARLAEPAPQGDNVVALRRRASAAELATIARAKQLEDGANARAASRARFAVSSGNAAKIAAMMALAATHQSIDVNDLDADPLAINLLDGTLRVSRADPESGCSDPVVRLDPHAPADRIAKLMQARWNPEAECPRWMAFVERFLPDPAVRWWVQRWHGYALTGLTDAQALAFNHGAGANGKTTFCEAIRRLMGDYAAALPAEAVTGIETRRSDQATPEWARLPGVRLVLVGELPRNQPLKEETIKLVTGGEPMLVRHLNKGFVEVRMRFKPVMTGNHRPQATGSDYAVWRRLRLVPWTVRLEEGERRPMGEVLAEFEAEADGILQWLVAGLLGYLREGLAPPPGIADATEEYRAEMDPVGEFIKQCTRPRPGAEVPAGALYDAYISWCRANGVAEWKQTRFGREMQSTGIRKTKSSTSKYLDIILHDVPQTPSDAPQAWG